MSCALVHCYNSRLSLGKSQPNVREGDVLFCPVTQEVASKPRKADAKMQVRVKARIVVVHVEMATKHVEGTGT